MTVTDLNLSLRTRFSGRPTIPGLARTPYQVSFGERRLLGATPQSVGNLERADPMTHGWFVSLSREYPTSLPKPVTAKRMLVTPTRERKFMKVELGARPTRVGSGPGGNCGHNAADGLLTRGDCNLAGSSKACCRLRQLPRAGLAAEKRYEVILKGLDPGLREGRPG